MIVTISSLMINVTSRMRRLPSKTSLLMIALMALLVIKPHLLPMIMKPALTLALIILPLSLPISLTLLLLLMVALNSSLSCKNSLLLIPVVIALLQNRLGSVSET